MDASLFFPISFLAILFGGAGFVFDRVSSASFIVNILTITTIIIISPREQQSQMTSSSDVIREDDYVFINGGGCKKIVQIKNDVKVRLGRSGAALATTLIGMRYGGVCNLDHGGKRFLETHEYPDLDITEVGNSEEVKDNRDLVDNNTNQRLSNDEVAAIRRDKGLGELLQTLVEKSASYGTKTNFAQEKYLKKKQKKYGTLFKLERVTVDNLAELHLPTINPSDGAPEEARCIRLRADALALILHHSDVHHNSRVLVYERTNGVLPASLLTRMGEEGRIFQVLDKNAQPDPSTAVKVFQLPNVKERWKAVPRNPGFLEGVEEPEKTAKSSRETVDDAAGASERAPRSHMGVGVSQWVKGLEAREMLLTQPADALVICDDDAPQRVMKDLFPFLANGGHIVVYSPFLEDLTGLFVEMRADCVNIQISETWYRHHQVLPMRTHPTVNMSTAGGYLLTAIKVGRGESASRVSAAPSSPTPAEDALVEESRKRSHDAEEPQDEAEKRAKVDVGAEESEKKA